MVRAIIFDLFGVIAPDIYWEWLQKQIPDLENQRNYFQNLSEEFDLGKLSTTQVIKTLADKAKVEEKDVIPFISRSVHVDNHVIELIRKLKRHYKTALLSNSNSTFTDRIASENDFETIFDTIVISEKVGYIKPQREIFELTLKQLGVSANEALFIDDRESNTHGGEKVGIKGIVYTGIDKLISDLEKENIQIS